MKILSIIIPSYNTEQYIDLCVPHYLKSKRKKDIEIIFVNDGSTDSTLLKLEQYVSGFPDFMRIVTKSNGGHGSAVNTGIKEARGKYFKVIDGDDWTDAADLDRLAECLKLTDADLILNPYYRVSRTTGKKKLCGVRKVEKNRVISLEELPVSIYALQLHEWTIKSSILKENRIRFTEHCFYDDFEYITFPIPFIHTMLFLDFPVYEYQVDQAAQSVSDASVFRNYRMNRKILFETMRYYMRNGRKCSARAGRYLSDSILNGAKQHYNIYLRNGREGDAYALMKEFDHEFRNEFPKIYEKMRMRYPYIKILSNGSKRAFHMLSMFMRGYKKLQQ